jgi:hypothetical protein
LPELALHPGGSPSLVYFSNNSTFANVPTTNAVCGLISKTPTVANISCNASPQNPSAVALANGNVGVAFSMITNATANSCPGAQDNTSSRVGWAVSADGGAHFGAVTDLGNLSCLGEQAVEPSFAAGSGGEVYGTYVQYNGTNASAPGSGVGWTPPWNLGYRASASLGFLRSADNGTSWSLPTSLPIAGSFVARPALAVSGDTVYIVYEAMNSTNALASGLSQNPKYNAPVALELVYSANGGQNWNGPFALPGEGSASYNSSVSPSIAVSSTGKVAVAYATNRSCAPGWCGFSAFVTTYAEDIVVATSTTNGSAWSGPYTVSSRIGESHCYGGAATWYTPACYRYLFEWTPQTSIAFNGGTVLASWAGLFARPGYVYYGQTYEVTGVFFGASTDGGATWSSMALASEPQFSGLDNYYSPAIAIASSGTVFATYTWQNATNCPAKPCSPFYSSISQWIRWSSDNGTTWSDPVALNLFHPPYGLRSIGGGWAGWRSSVVVPVGGSNPVAVYAVPQQYTEVTQKATNSSLRWFNYTWRTNLTASYLYNGPTTTVTFYETGLAPGTSWHVALTGERITGTAATIAVPGVPIGPTFYLEVGWAYHRGWTQSSGGLSGSPVSRSFSGPTNVSVHFTVSYGFQFFFNPNPCTSYYFHLSFTVNSTTYSYSCYSSTGYASPSYPWYLPAGLQVELAPTNSYYTYWNYWNGTGAGNYTGTGLDANVTIDGPINETLWAIAFGYYNESFRSVGLPSSSVFSFDLDGTAHSGPASSWLYVHNVTSGVHQLTNITANSSSAGWAYLGIASSGPSLVVPRVALVNLTYAYVNVAGPVANVTFTASEFTNGTVWQMALNGTRYSSSTPSIVIPLHSGTYPIWVAPTISGNGSVGLVPTGVGPSISVVAGNSYLISFTPGYRVNAVAGIGGSTTNGGVHWAPAGTVLRFNASATSAYTFGGWSGTGPGSYTGTDSHAVVSANGPINESAAFFALPTDRFNASFTAGNLAPGTSWTVYLNGVGYATRSPTLNVTNLYPCSAGALGLYNVSIPYVYDGANQTRYIPSGYPPQICLNGAYSRTITFSPEFLLTVEATAGGTAVASAGDGVSTTSLWVPQTQSPGVTATPDTGYTFLGWQGNGSGSYNGTTYSPQLQLSGPVSELAVFVPPTPRPIFNYTLTLEASGLASGTAWSVVFGGVGYSSSTPQLNITGHPNGSYSFLVPTTFSSDGRSQFQPSGVPLQVTISGNTIAAVLFQPWYWVEVNGSAGGNVTPSGSSWYPKGRLITIVATPAPGELFLGWTGSGPSHNYTGPDAAPSAFPVSGPLVEYGAFGPEPPAAKVVASAWSSPIVLGGLAVVGLAIGAVAGLALRRRRGRSGSATTEPPNDPGPAAAGETDPAWTPAEEGAPNYFPGENE